MSPEMWGVLITAGSVLGERIYSYGRNSKTIEGLEKKDAEQDGKIAKIADEVEGGLRSIRKWQEIHQKESMETRLQIERDISTVREDTGALEVKLDAVLAALSDLKKMVENIQFKN